MVGAQRSDGFSDPMEILWKIKELNRCIMMGQP